METHYTRLVEAFLRGKGVDPSPNPVDAARAAGLRIHNFKRKDGPARVGKTLGLLRGLHPSSLLDVGSGRGVFLWPLLDAFPELPVTAIDVLDRRVADLRAVADGAISRLTARKEDVTALPFEDGAFDACTVLEVLEHLERPSLAVAELLRVTQRFLVASVPSKPDDNPEHIQLFTPKTLEALFLDAGAQRVQMHYVLGHTIAVATL